MVAAIGGFFGLVVFIIIAIIASLLKKKQDREEAPPPFTPRGQPPSPPPARSWEEELRRVLEGTVLQPPVMTPPPPPRPVVGRMPPPAPFFELDSDAGRMAVDLPAPPPFVAPVFHQLPGLVESKTRYAGASSLQGRVARHMAAVSLHRVGTTTAHRAEIPAATCAVARSLRTPAGVRSAIIASIILGPPRALEG